MSMVIDALARTPREQAQHRGATLRRLLAEWRPYRRELAMGFVLVLVGAATQAAGPWLISRAIDQDIGHRDSAGLARTVALLFGVYVLGALASRGQLVAVSNTSQRVLADLRGRLFRQFMYLPLGYFDRRPLGDLLSRATADVDTLSQLLSQSLTQLLGSLFGLIGIVVAMLALNVRLGVVAFAIIPVMLLVTRYLAERARLAYRQTRLTTGEVTARLEEDIIGVREAQAFNRTEATIAQFRAENAANRDANVQATAITSAFAPTMDVLSMLATALVIGYGSYLVFQGELTVGLLAAFLIYVQQFFRPIQLASQVYAQMQAALAGAERIYAILDEPCEPPDPPDARVLTGTTGAIAYENVTFGYTPDQPVLHAITFQAEPGQAVAIVGSTGAGKSTLISLLPRFYDVQDGVVRLDGQDVRQVTRASLRAQIALVPQEPFLFDGSVAENIGYGRPGATREQIEQAARAVAAHDFIMELPQGYDTPVGERGGGLSQGQRQLVMFARAVLADRPILILDEATSNIDTRTERAIQQALAVLLRGRTSLAIAHRLSTIQNADLILVLEGGRIVERGTHQTLLAAGGRYAELYKLAIASGTA